MTKGIRVVCLLAVMAMFSAPVAACCVLQSSADPISEDAVVIGIEGALEVSDETAASSDVADAAPPAIWVKPMTSTVLLDDVFTVEVMKNSDEPLSAFDFHLMWDPTSIEFLGAAKGADVAETATFTDSRKAPAIRYVACLALGPEEAVSTGTRALAELEFKAIGLGSSAVDIIDSEEAGDIPVASPPVLADTENEPLPDLEVMDGEVEVVRSLVFLPLVVRDQ